MANGTRQSSGTAWREQRAEGCRVEEALLLKQYLRRKQAEPICWRSEAEAEAVPEGLPSAKGTNKRTLGLL